VHQAMIPQENISQIIETARIEEVVGDFVALKKRGVNLLGLCPFHDEKTPSFTVSSVKGIYKCFGCGKAGNAVRFIMDHEQYNYPEALRYLAKKYNIELDEKEQTPEDLQAANEKESLYIINQFAAGYFSKSMLDTDAGKAIALSYFKERGFDNATISRFQLGYSPDEWEAFTKAAIESGYQLDLLEKTGLTIVKEQNRSFDRFKGRVMFPIHNASGRVVGFGGRTLKNDKKTAKYINSPESDIYQKSKVLYGLYHAKKAITQTDNCYLVEGYTDVISLFQQGVENVVASSGTSLTDGQVKLIKRYTPNITILYDGDEAGINASFRGMEMILESGMNVKVVLFPDGEDPDSYARKLEKEEFKQYIEHNAQDFIRFKTTTLSKAAKNDPAQKAKLIKDTIETISRIPDAISRSVYIRECSDLLGVDERVLISELNKFRRKKIGSSSSYPEAPPPPGGMEDYFTDGPAPKQVDVTTESNSELQEKDLIRILLKHGRTEVKVELEQENEDNNDTAKRAWQHEEQEQPSIRIDEFIIQELQRDNIVMGNALHAKIYQLYVDLLNEEKEPSEAFFVHHEEEAVSATSIDIISSRYDLGNWESKNIFTSLEEDRLLRSVEKYLYYYKFTKVKQMINTIQRQLQNDPSTNEMTQLMQRQNALISAKKALASRLGIVTPS
jgi:DNA primase